MGSIFHRTAHGLPLPVEAHHVQKYFEPPTTRGQLIWLITASRPLNAGLSHLNSGDGDAIPAAVDGGNPSKPGVGRPSGDDPNRWDGNGPRAFHETRVRRHSRPALWLTALSQRWWKASHSLECWQNCLLAVL
jgi:hypothetical protein